MARSRRLVSAQSSGGRRASHKLATTNNFGLGVGARPPNSGAGPSASNRKPNDCSLQPIEWGPTGREGGGAINLIARSGPPDSSGPGGVLCARARVQLARVIGWLARTAGVGPGRRNMSHAWRSD